MLQWKANNLTIGAPHWRAGRRRMRTGGGACGGGGGVRWRQKKSSAGFFDSFKERNTFQWLQPFSFFYQPQVSSQPSSSNCARGIGPSVNESLQSKFINLAPNWNIYHLKALFILRFPPRAPGEGGEIKQPEADLVWAASSASTGGAAQRTWREAGRRETV